MSDARPKFSLSWRDAALAVGSSLVAIALSAGLVAAIGVALSGLGTELR